MRHYLTYKNDQVRLPIDSTGQPFLARVGDKIYYDGDWREVKDVKWFYDLKNNDWDSSYVEVVL